MVQIARCCSTFYLYFAVFKSSCAPAFIFLLLAACFAKIKSYLIDKPHIDNCGCR